MVQPNPVNKITIAIFEKLKSYSTYYHSDIVYLFTEKSEQNLNLKVIDWTISIC